MNYICSAEMPSRTIGACCKALGNAASRAMAVVRTWLEDLGVRPWKRTLSSMCHSSFLEGYNDIVVKKFLSGFTRKYFLFGRRVALELRLSGVKVRLGQTSWPY